MPAIAIEMLFLLFLLQSFTTICFGPYWPSSGGTQHQTSFCGVINTTTAPLFCANYSVLILQFSFYNVKTWIEIKSNIKINLKPLVFLLKRVTLVGGEWSSWRTHRFVTGERSLSIQEAGWAPKPVWTLWISENTWPYRNLNSGPLVIQSIASLMLIPFVVYTVWVLIIFLVFRWYILPPSSL
jgi:hypothetical protein